MSSKRVFRINNLIKRELGEIIIRELGLKGILTTITRVESSNNLSQAKIYISVIPEEKEEEVLELLNKDIYRIQQKLNKRIKIKFVPKIIFLREKKTKEADRVERILEKIKKSSLEK